MAILSGAARVSTEFSDWRVRIASLKREMMFIDKRIVAVREHQHEGRYTHHGAGGSEPGI